MIYSEFGNTGKSVSKLGFGTNRFPSQFLQDEKGLNHCADVVRHAIECGINYFDTGHNYDNSKSEQIFGLAFKNCNKPIYVSTKSSSHFDKTSDDVLIRVESSLISMGLQSISFYNMWGVMNQEHYRIVMAKNGPYEGLLKAKELGMIEHICISTHASAEEILKIINDGFYEGITISFNAMTAKAMKPVIEAAYKKSIAVVSMNTLGGGFIPAMPEYFEDLKTQDDDDIAMAALRFNISHKELTVALSGMGSIDIVDKNLKAFEDTSSIGKDRIRKHFLSDNPVFHAFCTGCGYCEPCPVNIPIKQFLTSYNIIYKPGYRSDVERKDKRNLSPVMNVIDNLVLRVTPKSIQNPCKQCGLCERRCTQNLPISERIQEIYDNMNCNETHISQLLNNIANRPVYIWGSGVFGVKALKVLHEIGIPVNGFIDSNSRKYGDFINSLTVQSPEILECNSAIKPYIIIGVSSLYMNEIISQLDVLRYVCDRDYCNKQLM